MGVGKFFETNLNELKKRDPEQAEMIAAAAPKIEHRLYAVEAVNPAYLNLTLSDAAGESFSLFSTPKPQEEIASWLQDAALGTQPEYSMILLGFGLGYHLQAITARLSEKGILAVVEPDPLLFFTAFHTVDLSEILQDSRIHYYVGQSISKSVESIGAEFEWSRFLSLPYRILVIPWLRRIHADFPRQFAETWRNALQRELMYRRSRIEHSTQVVIHTVANAEAIIRSTGVSYLFQHFHQVPAVLASAGPSLEKNLAVLHQVQERMLIACVNTAYPILRRYGIRPHLVFTMDHQERNRLSFREDSPPPETFLIADPRIDPRIIRHFAPRVFLASWRTTLEHLGEPAPLEQIPTSEMSGNAIYRWLQSMVGNKGDVFGAGSVAVVSFHILARLGCRPIVLMGQDLAFTEEKHYAEGTIFDDPKFSTDTEIAHWVPGVNGDRLPTSESLFLYQKCLEHEIARFGIPVFNTSSGAVINGTVTTRLETILENIPDRGIQISNILSSLHAHFVPRLDGLDLQKIFRTAIRQLNGFAEEAKQALSVFPLDPAITLNGNEKRQLLQDMEKAVEQCSQKHRSAFELLNELLQESHFRYEESRWRTFALSDENTILDDKLHSTAMVLDEFVKQAYFLITLFEEQIAELDR